MVQWPGVKKKTFGYGIVHNGYSLMSCPGLSLLLIFVELFSALKSENNWV